MDGENRKINLNSVHFHKLNFLLDFEEVLNFNEGVDRDKFVPEIGHSRQYRELLLKL